LDRGVEDIGVGQEHTLKTLEAKKKNGGTGVPNGVSARSWIVGKEAEKELGGGEFVLGKTGPVLQRGGSSG